MSPDEIRLECLKLVLVHAVPERGSKAVAYAGEVIETAGRFATFVTGQPATAAEPVEPGSMAEAIDALRREVPPLVRKTMAENYEP